MTAGRRPFARLGRIAPAVALLVAFALGAVLLRDRPAPGTAPGEPGGGPSAPVSDEMVQALLARTEDSGFARPSGPWEISLPRDHGGHPAARAETWMLAAQLEDAAGRPASVQFSLSRFGLVPETSAQTDESWALRALYRADLAVLQPGDTELRAGERFSRGAGAAGHDRQAGEVWLDDWTLSWETEPEAAPELALAARLGALRVDLSLVPEKAPVRAAGGDAPFRGFALSRLSVRGRILAEGEAVAVSGTAWLDRAWGELPLPGGPLGYDRLQLQLDDGTELSLVRTRRRDGRGPVTVDGFLVNASGGTVALSDGGLSMMPRDAGTAGAGDGPRYPVAWRLSGPDMDLDVAPLAGDGARAFAFGGRALPVRAEGRHAGRKVTGRGILQMTGYDAP